MAAPSVARDKLDAYGVDAVCEDIGAEKSMTAIALELGVGAGSLSEWCDAVPERSARVREARRSMARIWDERAEQVIKDAPDEFELKRARELAQHYRWRAKAIAPNEYGDRTTVAGDPTAPLVGLTDEQIDAKLAAYGIKLNG